MLGSLPRNTTYSGAINLYNRKDVFIGGRDKYFIEVIDFINENPFWKAQIAQIDITNNGELILYPQVTKQYVEFGTVENMRVKFKRLKMFYKNILPQQGWNKYSRISLKFKDQIICE